MLNFNIYNMKRKEW